MRKVARPGTGIAPPANLWDAAAARELRDLDALVYRSNLLGADRSVANQGGGNTSAKGLVVDHTGRQQRVLWVKGSGTDLATITSAGFAALRLDELEPLRSREAMDDASMVDYLRRCALAPGSMPTSLLMCRRIPPMRRRCSRSRRCSNCSSRATAPRESRTLPSRSAVPEGDTARSMSPSI